MSQAYCKWPVIAAIIVGSLVVISIIWCCARCLCCGAECCCGCLSCFNRCCPSPRGGKRGGGGGYEKPPLMPYQYQIPRPMYMGAQTARFDASSGGRGGKVHDDALPAMPTWSTATSHKVEDESEALEMEKLEQQNPTTALLQPQHRVESEMAYSGHEDGDMAEMHAEPYRSPYQSQAQTGSYYGQQVAAYPAQSQSYNAQTNAYQSQGTGYHQPQNSYYAQQQQQAPSPYESQPQTQSAYEATPTSPYEVQNPYQPYAAHSQPQHQYQTQQQYANPVSPTSTTSTAYPPTYHTNQPPSTYGAGSAYGAAYSAGPPGYQTAPPSVASPSQQYAQPQAGYGLGRKPVSGSWRDV